MDQAREWRAHLGRHQTLIFSVSTAMVGVCLTAISMIRVAKALSSFATWCDDFLAVDSALFLAAALLAYASFRKFFTGRWRVLHLAADVLMIAGMTLMAVVSFLLAWALA